MIGDKYISDYEHRQFIERNSNRISQCWKIIKKFEGWYAEQGFEFMLSCCTNYRDSWFHYRKLYIERSFLQNVREEYALEEHLHRLTKDLVVDFFQQIVELLQIWNSYEEVITAAERSRLEIKLSGYGICVGKNNWVKDVLCNFSEKESKTICKQIYLSYIESEEVHRVIRNNLHNMKNIIMKLRYGGANIERNLLGDSGVQNYEQQYMTFKSDVDRVGMKYLLSAGPYIFRDDGL